MRPTLGIYAIQDRNEHPIPGYTHDHSICLMRNGSVEKYLQLERWTRRKYDNQMHLHLEPLWDAGLLPEAEEADWVFVNSFVGASFLSQNGRFRAEAKPREQLHVGLHPMKAWGEFGDRKGHAINAWSIDHELAHVCSNLPFYGPFHENSLHIHFDGGASLSNCSVFRYRNGKLENLDYHWRLGYLSKFFNDNALTFALLNHGPGEHCAVPGKLMGFATLGTARPELKDWLQAHSYFKEIWNDHTKFYQSAQEDFGWQGTLGDTRDPFLQNIAASFQEIFQENWLAYITELQQLFPCDDLYLSGGCALNIVANTLIVQSGLFRDVFIPPCPGDSGLSLGAAAYLEWQKHGQVQTHLPFLNNMGLQISPQNHTLETVKQVGDAIAAGAIVGLYQGAAEVGPRALGHRSIIAGADSKSLAKKVSVTCKGREWYRPIAPVMLEKNAQRITGFSNIHPLSQYMLLDFAIPAQHQMEIAGTVHQNGTARIQTLFTRAFNPFLWDLLTYLNEMHHIPALINTSFNTQGEPIVHTPEQAIASATKMNLDGLILHSTYYPSIVSANLCES